jgi:hypothetical protein
VRSLRRDPGGDPLQSKIDVGCLPPRAGGGLRHRLGEADVDLARRRVRPLQNQLRSNTKMQVLEPDTPPLNDALEKVLERTR